MVSVLTVGLLASLYVGAGLGYGLHVEETNDINPLEKFILLVIWPIPAYISFTKRLFENIC